VDPDALSFFHSPGEKGFGNAITGWSNRRFDQLSERAISLSLEERTPLLAEMQQILARDQPVSVLWYPEGRWAYRPAAHAGWITDRGHGILIKRSFLRPYAQAAAVSGPVSEDGGSSAAWIVLAEDKGFE